MCLIQLETTVNTITAKADQQGQTEAGQINYDPDEIDVKTIIQRYVIKPL